ncbi:LacI family DNA-binding transcriptional regulator [uncultured Lutibacter sp.]|uniref:LacI family DNA-binding transcriptional regulator n=1 Tax=uncultured Lutibacter sp. TaxID=437739 RepID=UPI0026376BDC|nr:LacI family DNA-binding transcriptional regulator [uncultured Lutibacter sp.]
MVTIKDIARIANVSVGTVDRVIHNRQGVSEKTKVKVNKILKENNFKINVIARSLAMKKKYTVAVLIPEFREENLFWKSPLMGISKASDEVLSFGVEVELFSFNQSDCDSYLKQFELLIKLNPKAVILAPFFLKETKLMVSKLEAKGIPYMFLNLEAEGFNNCSFIGQDSYKAGYLTGKLMYLSTGDNSTYLVSIINSNLFNNIVIEKRIKGFEDFFKKNKIKFKIRNVNFDDLEDDNLISKTINTLLNDDKSIKGILVPSSRIATISNCISEQNLVNIRLIGFDTTEQNIEQLRKNRITFLISQKSFNQGYTAVNEMADYLIHNKVPQKKIFFPIEIVTKENEEFSQRNKWEFNSLSNI